MPWTRKQVRYLLSSGSPLTQEQREDMQDELHDNPALGHAKKRAKGKRKLKKGEFRKGGMDWRDYD